MIISATECTIYSNITASAATILTNNLIPIVQTRLTMMLNNYFATAIEIESTATFDTSARTITLDSANWVDYGFLAGDDVMIYRSLRNDNVVTIASLSNTVAVLTSSCSVVGESFLNNSSRMITFNRINWPLDVKAVAAKMCAYDYDVRDSVSSNIKSRSLGPLSETFTDGESDEYGYPKKLTGILEQYRLMRMY